MKNPKTFELFGPEDVGLERKIIIGKNSGVNTLIQKLKSLGLKIREKEAEELSEIIREKALAFKRALFDSEIIEAYNSFMKSKAEKIGAESKGGNK